MSDHVSWMLELNIKTGELANLKALISEMVESTRANEPGTLNYEWYFDSEERMSYLGTVCGQCGRDDPSWAFW